MGIELKITKNIMAKNLENALKNLNNKVAKVGWFEGSKYDDPQETPVAQVAYNNENGNPSKNVPARPFIRPTIERQRNHWKQQAFIGSKKIIKGKFTVDKLLESIGQNAKSEIQKTISQIWSPPLRPSTIKARMERYAEGEGLSESTKKSRKIKLKKFVPKSLYKPLIDTGLMLSTIINKVEEE
jgi:hypothetical protein